MFQILKETFLFVRLMHKPMTKTALYFTFLLRMLLSSIPAMALLSTAQEVRQLACKIAHPMAFRLSTFIVAPTNRPLLIAMESKEQAPKDQLQYQI